MDETLIIPSEPECIRTKEKEPDSVMELTIPTLEPRPTIVSWLHVIIGQMSIHFF